MPAEVSTPVKPDLLLQKQQGDKDGFTEENLSNNISNIQDETLNMKEVSESMIPGASELDSFEVVTEIDILSTVTHEAQIIKDLPEVVKIEKVDMDNKAMSI